ncbi:hypothetical protein [Streptomyces sp. PBH53]|uniref:hypothetical protein n=1 Tax=Streptomyces sp. PBH53 TaxID=1577075 RepID=UPI001AD822CB
MPVPRAHLRLAVLPRLRFAGVADEGLLERDVQEVAVGGPAGVFHVSVAENGAQRHAFTVRGTSVDVRGSVPDALDPERLFRADEPRTGRLGERRALEALAAEYGVRLPRLALTRGRLHTFRTLPWNRPPGPGEGCATLRFVRTGRSAGGVEGRGA